MNYAKDEVTIALDNELGGTYIGEDDYTLTSNYVEATNINGVHGHNDWMLPNLFDAKRCIKNLTGDDADKEMWTSDTYDATANKIVKYIDEKVVVSHKSKSTTQHFFVIRKQVVTA